MSSRSRAAMAAAVALVVAVGTPGTANADNSNSNTNNNDVTQQGGPGGGSGSGGSEKTNWPPTDLGWPPKEVMSGDVGESAASSKGNQNESSSSTPIVTPGRPTAPAAAAGTSTDKTPNPIVAASAS